MTYNLLFLLQLPGDMPSRGVLAFLPDLDPVGKVVLSILVIFSIASWTVMISKSLQLRRASSASRRFLAAFRQSSRFSEISAVTSRHAASPLVGLFQAGYVEIDAQVKAQRERAQRPTSRSESERTEASGYQIKSMTGIERSLRRAAGIEALALTRFTQFLATTAATTPFIGLFGTVWGIMLAFNDIGSSGNASIAVVAPGIAEALINTAAGLAAAIPALVGYNQLAGRIRHLRLEMDDFALEFLNLAERNFT